MVCLFSNGGGSKIKPLLYGEPERSLPSQRPNNQYQRRSRTITTNSEPERSIPTQSPNDRYQRKAQKITTNAESKLINIKEEPKSITINAEPKYITINVPVAGWEWEWEWSGKWEVGGSPSVEKRAGRETLSIAIEMLVMNEKRWAEIMTKNTLPVVHRREMIVHTVH
ncbi:hypothetical protein, partial, partial [Absidia glauca]